MVGSYQILDCAGYAVKFYPELSDALCYWKNVAAIHNATLHKGFLTFPLIVSSLVFGVQSPARDYIRAVF